MSKVLNILNERERNNGRKAKTKQKFQNFRQLFKTSGGRRVRNERKKRKIV